MHIFRNDTLYKITKQCVSDKHHSAVEMFLCAHPWSAIHRENQA